MWGGFGGALWWAARGPRSRAALLRILLGAVCVGGVGRLLAAARVGAGPPVLAALIAIELVGAPAVLVWHRRLLRSSGREHPVPGTT